MSVPNRNRPGSMGDAAAMATAAASTSPLASPDISDLQPVLKMKVNELFTRWMGNEDVRRALDEIFQQLLDLDDDVTAGEEAAPDSVGTGSGGGAAVSTPNGNSTDLSHASLTTSPRSPRQPAHAVPGSGAPPSPRSLCTLLGGQRIPRRTLRSKQVAPASNAPAGVKDKKLLPPPLPKPHAAPTHSLVPRFYFPHGRPAPNGPTSDQMIERVEESFAAYPDERANIQQMAVVAKACGCPVYWKSALFHAASGERTGFVSVHTFVAMWRKLLRTCHDDSAKFVALLARPGCNYLVQEDFIPLLQDIVDSHPGLTFLKDAPEFHSRYITTVIQRVFYVVNRSWSGRISLTELRKSNFLQTLALLEEEEDINQITDYFSYEHFYVIYCKFWELDTDHDLYIDRKDLAKHNDHAISSRMIDRIFSGAVTRGPATKREKRMSYADFVWFLISEEDKKTPTSVEYWFRCMDLDGDGVLSMYELEHFYAEQCARMDKLGIEPLPLSDCLCQMLDLVKPQVEGKITLKDLKRCRMAYVFFDTFFNLEKYLEHEQKDPFSVQKEADGEVPESSDWDRYAAEEYEILVAEESANQQLQAISYEEELEEALLGKQVGRLTLSDPPNPATRFSDDQYEYDDDFEY